MTDTTDLDGRKGSEVGRRRMPLRRPLAGLALLALLVPAALGADSANDTVARFAREAGIEAWPPLAGCGFPLSLKNRVVGLIVDIEGPERLAVRWDGRCHVPIRLRYTGWATPLPRGQYIVAATDDGREETDGLHYYRSERLRLLAVLGGKPASDALLAAAIDRLCAEPLGRSSPIKDRDCEPPEFRPR